MPVDPTGGIRPHTPVGGPQGAANHQGISAGGIANQLIHDAGKGKKTYINGTRQEQAQTQMQKLLNEILQDWQAIVKAVRDGDGKSIQGLVKKLVTDLQAAMKFANNGNAAWAKGLDPKFVAQVQKTLKGELGNLEKTFEGNPMMGSAFTKFFKGDTNAGTLVHHISGDLTAIMNLPPGAVKNKDLAGLDTITTKTSEQIQSIVDLNNLLVAKLRILQAMMKSMLQAANQVVSKFFKTYLTMISQIKGG